MWPETEAEEHNQPWPANPVEKIRCPLQLTINSNSPKNAHNPDLLSLKRHISEHIIFQSATVITAVKHQAMKCNQELSALLRTQVSFRKTASLSDMMAFIPCMSERWFSTAADTGKNKNWDINQVLQKLPGCHESTLQPSLFPTGICQHCKSLSKHTTHVTLLTLWKHFNTIWAIKIQLNEPYPCCLSDGSKSNTGAYLGSGWGWGAHYSTLTFSTVRWKHTHLHTRTNSWTHAFVRGSVCGLPSCHVRRLLKMKNRNACQTDFLHLQQQMHLHAHTHAKHTHQQIYYLFKHLKERPHLHQDS